MSFLQKQTKFSIRYDDESGILKLTAFLHSIIPRANVAYVVICIGTDRSTGDSLGPLTGTLLKENSLQHLSVYGSLHEPVHALNLHEYVDYIHHHYKNPYIIAVDASLGKRSSIGTIYSSNKALQPGSALKKNLPAIGHAHIVATVNLNSNLNYITLQNTRLSLVYDMAHRLAHSLYKLDLRLRQKEYTSRSSSDASKLI